MWRNLQFSADLVAFSEEILIENFIFCAVRQRNLIFIIFKKLEGENLNNICRKSDNKEKSGKDEAGEKARLTQQRT